MCEDNNYGGMYGDDYGNSGLDFFETSGGPGLHQDTDGGSTVNWDPDWDAFNKLDPDWWALGQIAIDSGAIIQNFGEGLAGAGVVAKAPFLVFGGSFIFVVGGGYEISGHAMQYFGDK